MISNRTKSEIKYQTKLAFLTKKCFIVAEISANHSGDLKILRKALSKRMWGRCNQNTVI